jgi:uncharacterized membrane protein
MTRTMGSMDRALIGIPALLGAFALGWFPSWMDWAAAIVGVIMLLTATVGFYPLYRRVGINTCRI